MVIGLFTRDVFPDINTQIQPVIFLSSRKGIEKPLIRNSDIGFESSKLVSLKMIAYASAGMTVLIASNLLENEFTFKRKERYGRF